MKKLLPYALLCIGIGGAVAWARREFPFAFAAADALTVAGGATFALCALFRFFASEYADGAAYALRFRAAFFSRGVTSFEKFKEERKRKRGTEKTDGAWLGGVLFLFGLLFLPFF